MARIFSVNANNDIFAVNGRLQISSGQSAVLIHCERAIKANFAEMILATNRGVNYFQDVFSGSPDIIKFEAGARAQLRRIENVVSIDQFDAEVRDNQLIYSATIRTTFGSGSISNSINLGLGS